MTPTMHKKTVSSHERNPMNTNLVRIGSILVVALTGCVVTGCAMNTMRDGETRAMNMVFAPPFTKAELANQGLHMTNKADGEEWEIDFGQKDVKTEGGDLTQVVLALVNAFSGAAAQPKPEPQTRPLDVILEELAERIIQKVEANTK